MGRPTYEEVRAFWSTADQQPMARRVDALAKTVASTTLAEAPWGHHAPGRVVRDAVAHVSSRLDDSGGDTIVWGSIHLMQSLLAAGAVWGLSPERHQPRATHRTGRPGERHPLPATDGQPVRLQLRESQTWPAAVVRTRYTAGTPA